MYWNHNGHIAKNNNAVMNDGNVSFSSRAELKKAVRKLL